MTESALKHQLDQALRPQRRSAVSDGSVHAALMVRIRSGELLVATRRGIVALRRILLATQVLVGALNVAAVVALVWAVAESGTVDFVSLALQLTDFRGEAWQAALESLPVTALLTLLAALGGLAATYLARRYVSRQNLIA